MLTGHASLKTPTCAVGMLDSIVMLILFSLKKTQVFFTGQPSRVSCTVIPHPPLHRAGKANWGLRELRRAEGVKGEE